MFNLVCLLHTPLRSTREREIWHFHTIFHNVQYCTDTVEAPRLRQVSIFQTLPGGRGDRKNLGGGDRTRRQERDQGVYVTDDPEI